MKTKVNRLPGIDYYFKSFKSKERPFVPIEEIDKDEAIDLKKNGYAYCVANYDRIGRIVRFKKHLPSDEVMFDAEYSYDYPKKIRQVLKKSNGSHQINYFQKK